MACCTARSGRWPVVSWLVGYLACAAVWGAPSETPNEFRGVGLWDTTFNLDAGLGYKDNILLGPIPTEHSAFVASGLDFSAIRLPLDGTRFLAFLTGTDQRYFSTTQVDAEQTLIGYVQVKRDLSEAWQVGMTAQGAYLDQVFDATDVTGNFGILQGQGFSVTGRPSLRRNLPGHYWVEFEFSVCRQYLKQPLDNFWEGGPKLTLGHAFARRSEWGLSFELNRRGYDHRTTTTSDGSAVEGVTLEFLQPKGELTWQQDWDEKRRWRSTTRLGFLGNWDNGSGYYDYTRGQIGEQVRYRVESWEIRAQIRYAFYHYSILPVSAQDSSPVRRTDVELGLRVERRLSRGLKAYIDYEHERSLSNQAFTEYAANTGTVGIDWEF